MAFDINGILKKSLPGAVTVCLSLIIGFGGSYIAMRVAVAKLEERIGHMEHIQQLHEKTSLHDDERREIAIENLKNQTNAHEARIARLEAHTDKIAADMGEIKSDLKTLLRQHMEVKR